MANEGWRVSVSPEWDVLGPFPIHAREQHFLSPSFPLDLAQPVDLSATYPSAYADGGVVGWSKAHSQGDGTLTVAFPQIRWESLRATEGWAALQHHSVLRSTFTVHPPSPSKGPLATPPRLHVELLQGSFFTILPAASRDQWRDAGAVPQWHAGNIYAMGRSPPNAVSLPMHPSSSEPTTYNIFVSGDYEIRLFGDPGRENGGVPQLSISLKLDIEEPAHTIAWDATQDVYPDFVDGWAFGDALGVGLYSSDGWWSVESITASDELHGFIRFEAARQTRLAPSQRRTVPIRLTQTQPIQVEQLKLTLIATSGDITATVEIDIPVRNRARWTDDSTRAIKATYFSGASTPIIFVVAPPEKPNDGPPRPPVLALHGAGVDIIDDDFWIQAIPRQQHSWIIAPSGRTPWGMDWHGPSAQDAWDTVGALYEILSKRDEWQQWNIAAETKVLLMGHSNGGQGAWYLAARYPDRVIGVVPAAGYIKSQSYVPWVQSRSAHYVDPAIRAILDSSLTPDDNDLFLSNLVDTPVFAIHGGDDNNVPVWHTREAVSVLKTWNARANVTFCEDPGQLHWYPSVFANDQVQSFISTALHSPTWETPATSRSFTLTVAIPADSGSLHGWSIHSLGIPGRLGRLTVKLYGDAIRVRTTNVKAFSIHIGSLPESLHHKPFVFDGQEITLDEATWNLSKYSLSVVQDRGYWVLHPLGAIGVASPSGRLSNVLTSTGPLTIVIPTKQPSVELSAALRLAHNLHVYHRLDTEIIDDQEALHRLGRASFSDGNVIVVGLGAFAKSMAEQGKTAFGVRDGALVLRGRPLDEPSTAVLFLHPHPTRVASSLLFIYGSDAAGLERGLRLFPIRTGITVPDWIVVGSHADERGTGGVEGAGVWDNDWGWNEVVSAF